MKVVHNFFSGVKVTYGLVVQFITGIFLFWNKSIEDIRFGKNCYFWQRIEHD